MPKYSIVLEYIGTNYSGSQVQPDKVTIQSELNKALCTLNRDIGFDKNDNPKTIKTIFSGRTDAGVHSKGQVVHFESSKPIVASRFLNSLNGLLPDDISVKSIQEVDEDFHAQLSAKYRVYQYKIVNRQQRSVWDGHSLLIREPLDVERMNKSLSFLIGEHDFTSFKSARTENPAKDCVVYKAECIKQGDVITFEIAANRFLYNMVRTIVGTMLKIEHEKLDPEFMKQVLEAKDRTKAGATISPDGLTLVEVGYKSYLCHSELGSESPAVGRSILK